MSTNSERRQLLEEAFHTQFEAAPSLWCRAPGRVDLMGSHTDYNEGFVLTLPIDRDTWIAAHPRPDRVVRLHSLNLDTATRFSLDDPSADRGERWADYVRGVASSLQNDGLELSGFDAVVHSTVPMSSGLSSSAALECAVATVFEQMAHWSLDPVKKAKLCQQAENEFVGVNCGILDQYTSCAGEEGCALLLDCRDVTSRTVQLPRDLCVVICDTRAKRELAGSEYGQRRAQCEAGARQLGVTALRDVPREHFEAQAAALDPEVAQRCRFIVEENDRVRQLATALPANDRAAIHDLCAASFQGAMTLYEIGIPAMQAMMDAMLAAPGVVGARQAGAGFGGCMVAFVESNRVDSFARTVRRQYQTATGTEPEIYAVTAAAGAGLVP